MYQTKHQLGYGVLFVLASGFDCCIRGYNVHFVVVICVSVVLSHEDYLFSFLFYLSQLFY